MIVCGQIECVWNAFYLARGDGDEVRSTSYKTDAQVMDAVCMLYLAILLEAGSAIQAMLQDRSREILHVVSMALRVRAGVLESSSKAKSTVSDG